MKIKLPSITYIIATVLSLASMICLFIGNGVEGYAMAGFGLALTPSILAIIVCAAGIILHAMPKIHDIVKVSIGFIAICLICWYFGNIILQRSELVAAQFTYDKVNKLGWQALIPSLISIGLSIISAISITIGAFLKDR